MTDLLRNAPYYLDNFGRKRIKCMPFPIFSLALIGIHIIHLQVIPENNKDLLSVPEDKRKKSWIVRYHHLLDPKLTLEEISKQVKFQESFSVVYIDTDDNLLMKNNIWLKQVNKLNQIFFVVKFSPQKMQNMLYFDESKSENFQEIVDKINQVANLNVTTTSLQVFVRLVVRRFNVSEKDHYLDVTRFPGGKQYVSMNYKKSFNGITENEFVGEINKLASKTVFKNKTATKICVYLREEKKDLYRILSKKLSLKIPKSTSNFVFSKTTDLSMFSGDQKWDDITRDYLSESEVKKLEMSYEKVN